MFGDIVGGIEGAVKVVESPPGLFWAVAGRAGSGGVLSGERGSLGGEDQAAELGQRARLIID